MAILKAWDCYVFGVDATGTCRGDEQKCMLMLGKRLRFATLGEEVEVHTGGGLMNRLIYLIPFSVIAVLAFAAPALTQTAPDSIDVSPAQEAGTVQTAGDASADPAPAENTASAPSPEPASSSTKTVDISNHAFNPAQLNVAPGTTVTFVNNDTEPHTATADNGLFDTGVLESGSSFDVFFDGNGTVTYHCELHPDMRGSIGVLLRLPLVA